MSFVISSCVHRNSHQSLTAQTQHPALAVPPLRSLSWFWTLIILHRTILTKTFWEAWAWILESKGKDAACYFLTDFPKDDTCRRVISWKLQKKCKCFTLTCLLHCFNYCLMNFSPQNISLVWLSKWETSHSRAVRMKGRGKTNTKTHTNEERQKNAHRDLKIITPFLFLLFFSHFLSWAF